MSDYACAGLGTPADKPSDYKKYLVFNTFLELHLIEHRTASRFKKRRMKVIPKVACTNVGASVDSLSLYLTCIYTEKDIWWRPIRLHPLIKGISGQDSGTMRLLLLPHPFQLRNQVEVSKGKMHDQTKDKFGYYDIEVPRLAEGDAARLMGTVTNAFRKYDDISGIIMSELSVHEDELGLFEQLFDLYPCLRFVMVGTSSRSVLSGKQTNELRVITSAEQYRHRNQNRWRLNASQIQTYGFGNLTLSKDHYEYIDISQRETIFLASSYGVTICPIICEDLARIASDINTIKNVGPTLVIAVLQDGPQIDTRWASRHASSLADDPGCGVLTLTSSAMVQQSNKSTGREDPKLAIASWKGGQSSSLCSIKAAENCSCVVSFKIESRPVYSTTGEVAYGYQLTMSDDVAEIEPSSAVVYCRSRALTLPEPNDQPWMGSVTAMYTAVKYSAATHGVSGSNDTRLLVEKIFRSKKFAETDGSPAAQCVWDASRNADFWNLTEEGLDAYMQEQHPKVARYFS